MEKKRFIVLVFLTITLVGAILVSGCSNTSQTNTNNEMPMEEKVPKQTAQTKESETQVPEKINLGETLPAKFAVYEGIGVSYNPSVELYHVEDSLNNIINKNDFQFSPTAQKLLVENGFVVVPAEHREFFPLYEMNRYEYTQLCYYRLSNA